MNHGVNDYRPFGKPEWALMLITVFWGGTFLLVQLALSMSDPFFLWGYVLLVLLLLLVYVLGVS